MARRSPIPYQPPDNVQTADLAVLLEGTGRRLAATEQTGLFGASNGSGLSVYFAGDPGLLQRPCVAIVGTRRVSQRGAARARRMARELTAAGVVVVSGLAMGVDTEALTAAIAANGSTIGVIGTPLDKATPKASGPLQERMWREHLVLSQFAMGAQVHRSNFPLRNRTMAAVSDGTIIIEASDKSGTLHQAAECTRLGRWLFILQSVIDDPKVSWPGDFLKYKTTVVVSSSQAVLSRLATG